MPVTRLNFASAIIFLWCARCLTFDREQFALDGSGSSCYHTSRRLAIIGRIRRMVSEIHDCWVLTWNMRLGVDAGLSRILLPHTPEDGNICTVGRALSAWNGTEVDRITYTLPSTFGMAGPS